MAIVATCKSINDSGNFTFITFVANSDGAEYRICQKSDVPLMYVVRGEYSIAIDTLPIPLKVEDA